MSEPKKHHFVPECYLNEYSDNRELYCLDLKLLFERGKIHISRKNPSQICYSENFYLIRNFEFYNLEKYEEYFIEKMALKRLEDKYRKMINKIIQNKKANRIESLSISDFILNLKIRNPVYLKIAEKNKLKNIEEVKVSLFNKVIKLRRFKNVPKDLIKFIIDSTSENLVKNEKYIKSVQIKQIIDKTNPNSSSIDKFREAILNCKWFILDAINCKSIFLTSDNPGVSVSSLGKIENTKFKGGFEYYFPINSRYCLYFSDKILDNFFSSGLIGEKKIEIHEIGENEIIFINSILIGFINKYIIGGNKSNLYDFAESIKKFI